MNSVNVHKKSEVKLFINSISFGTEVKLQSPDRSPREKIWLYVCEMFVIEEGIHQFVYLPQVKDITDQSKEIPSLSSIQSHWE